MRYSKSKRKGLSANLSALRWSNEAYVEVAMLFMKTINRSAYSLAERPVRPLTRTSVWVMSKLHMPSLTNLFSLTYEENESQHRLSRYHFINGKNRGAVNYAHLAFSLSSDLTDFM